MTALVYILDLGDGLSPIPCPSQDRASQLARLYLGLRSMERDPEMRERIERLAAVSVMSRLENDGQR